MSPGGQAVLLDLDGTLLDTAPDLIGALNALRAEEGLPALPAERVRPTLSHGAEVMVRNAFGIDRGRRCEGLHARLLALYRERLCAETRPFPGIEPLLGRLEARGIPWGVLTNKPAALTEPLLAGLGLAARAAAVVSGDRVARPKPDPLPVREACRAMGVAPPGCLAVGDARRDVEAATRAGARALVALFGYLGGADDVARWGADGLVRTPAEIEAYLAPAAGERPVRRGAG